MTAPARSRRGGRARPSERRPARRSGRPDTGGVPRAPEERFARPPVRIAFRMAARTARRSLGRSILVAVMIAVPVAGMAGTVVVSSSMVPTRGELVALQLGAEAEAVLQIVAPPGTEIRQDVTAPVQGWWDSGPDSYEVPEGDLLSVSDVEDLVEGELVVESFATAVVETPDGIRQVSALEGDLLRPELDGRFELLDGAAPARAGEIAVTPSLLATLDATVGGTATLLSNDSSTVVDIVGVYRTSDTPSVTDEMLASPGTFEEGATTANRLYLLDQQLTWDDVMALNEQGVIAASRSVLLGDEPTSGARADQIGAFGFTGGYLAVAALIGGFLLLQVVLLAAAAFMVGARQQQRALAVLASVGGDRRLMRATVTAGGVVLGLVGGLLGVGLGVAGAAATIPLISDGRAMSFPGFHVDLLLLLIVLAAAVLAGWAAAAVPARIASRVDIVPALRGARRPPVPRRATRVASLAVSIIGLALLAAGGIVLVVVRGLPEYPQEVDIVAIGLIGLGAVVVQLGIVLGLPSILRMLARATSGGRTSLRLAARDAGRNSARTVPVTAAVMTTVFIASFIMSVLGALQVEEDEAYTPRAPINTVAIPILVFDPVTQTEVEFDDIDGISAALADIAPSAETAVIGAAPREPQYTYDPATGASSAAPVSEGETFAQVFPVDDACRDVFASTFSNEDDDCAAPRSDLERLSAGTMIRGDIGVGTVQALELFSGMSFTDEARRALESGGAIALSPLLVEGGEVTIDRLPAEDFAVEPGEFFSPATVEPESSDVLRAEVQIPDGPSVARILVLPSTAEALDLDVRNELVVAQMDEPPTLAQRDAITALPQTVTGDPYRFYPYIETGPPDQSTIATWALVAVSAVIALAASSIAIGLARIDGRRDEAILGAMGATRSLRRAVSLWQAILLAGVGTLIGAALGVLTAGALALPGGPLPFAPPWLPLAIVGVGVPVLIGIGAWLFAGKSTALPTDRSAIS